MMSTLGGAVGRRGGPPYAMPTAAPYNAPTYCPTPTYDNTGSCTHFSVIDMHGEIGKDWRGFRFWGCMTPYYRQDDRLENPSILASQDGYHWVLPNGAQNPLYPPPINEAGWNADADLAYDPNSDELVMAFSAYDLLDHGIVRSRNGAAWPPRPSPAGLREERAGSPSIFRDTDGSWLYYGIYTAGSGSSGIRDLRRWRIASSGGPFDKLGFVTCTGTSGMQADGLWHGEVLVDRAGVYRALFWAGWTSGHVYAGSSTDGVAWAYSAAPVLRPASVEPSLSGLARWDSSELYRGSFTEGLPGEDFWRVWYAGTPGKTNTGTSWRIGYTQIPKTAWPAPPA